jgi:MinD superfamily P-loop ATPase
MVLLLGECNGCEACFLVCQEEAILKDKRQVGRTFKSEVGRLTLYTGELTPGLEESTLVVNALKERVFREADLYDYIVIDTSPGTHCNVINALKGSDNVITVTEPTPLGSHDLDLILSLLDYFKVKRSVFINRADIGSAKKSIFPVTQKHNTPIETGLKVDPHLLQSYVDGVPVSQMFPESIAANTFKQVAQNIVNKK